MASSCPICWARATSGPCAICRSSGRFPAASSEKSAGSTCWRTSAGRAGHRAGASVPRRSSSISLLRVAPCWEAREAISSGRQASGAQSRRRLSSAPPAAWGKKGGQRRKRHVLNGSGTGCSWLRGHLVGPSLVGLRPTECPERSWCNVCRHKPARAASECWRGAPACPPGTPAARWGCRCPGTCRWQAPGQAQRAPCLRPCSPARCSRSSGPAGHGQGRAGQRVLGSSGRPGAGYPQFLRFWLGTKEDMPCAPSAPTLRLQGVPVSSPAAALSDWRLPLAGSAHLPATAAPLAAERPPGRAPPQPPPKPPAPPGVPSTPGCPSASWLLLVAAAGWHRPQQGSPRVQDPPGQRCRAASLA